MSILADSGTLIPGSIVASVYPGLGAPGVAIKAASAIGEQGAGVGMNDGLVDTKDYIFEVLSQPSPSGSVAFISELGQATMTVPADGTYTWTYRLREDGTYQTPDPATVTITVGVSSLSLVAAACAQVNSCPAVSVSMGPGTLPLTVASFAQVNSTYVGAVTLGGGGSGGGGVVYLPPIMIGLTRDGQAVYFL